MNDNTIRALYLGKIRPEKSHGLATGKHPAKVAFLLLASNSLTSSRAGL